MFLISIFLPNSFAPCGRTLTLTSHRTIAFFHVAIADAAVTKNFDQGVEIIVGHLGAGDFRLGNDFQQRHAGAVEIHPAVALEMKILADILLQMGARDMRTRLMPPSNSNSTKPLTVEGLSYWVIW
jgi:hypothetical protein